MTRLFWSCFLFVAVAGLAPADESLPKEISDPAFARYFDPAAFRDAYLKQDPAAMLDVALQLADGERVLLRSHKAFSADQLFDLTATFIKARGADDAVQQRLVKAVEARPNKELKAHVKDVVERTRSVNLPILVDPNAEKYAARPQVLIYYANEPALTPAARKNLDTVTAWLRDASDPRANKFADRIESDVKDFTAVIDKEVDQIKAAVKAGEGVPAGVALFTNRLAARKQLEVFHKGQAGFETVEWGVPDSDDYLYTSHPLANPAVFEKALRTVADRFDPAKYSFVLVTKSHGSSHLVLTPFITVKAETTTKEDFLRLVKENLERSDKNPPKRCEYLVIRSGKPVQTEGGKIIQVREGRLLLGDAELAVKDGVFVNAAKGEPVHARGGDPIAVKELQLALARGGRVVVNGDDQPIWARSLAKLVDKGELPTLPAAVALRPGLDADKMDNPIISADKMENPILDSDKMENPILDSDKMENPILESVEAPVVGRSALLIGVDPVGVSKARYTATLGRLGKERSMYFMAAFIESCRSELSADELAAISGPARNVGMLYTSDQKGLTYSTLDYAELLDKKNADKPLSASLRAFLLRKHEEGKPKPN